MSEYQYFEFQAIDRPLTPEEMAVLRKFSGRARITPSSFTNEYNYGDFKGDRWAWMENCFNAFLQQYAMLGAGASDSAKTGK